jgi:nitroreductase
MVRTYDLSRPVPAEVTDRIIGNGLRAPSAGFSQGWAFLVLDKADDVARFRDVVRPEDHPENWFAANVVAPLLIIPHSNKDAYLDRYALPDKGFTDRSDAWWPAPYWDIDTGFASLLMLLTAVDAGLGACFFGIPVERIDAYRAAFGVPAQFKPIGAISVGYSDEPPRDLSGRRKPKAETVHRGRWTHPGQ